MSRFLYEPNARDVRDFVFLFYICFSLSLWGSHRDDVLGRLKGPSSVGTIYDEVLGNPHPSTLVVDLFYWLHVLREAVLFEGESNFEL